MRVFVVDADPDVRSALRIVLEQEAGVSVVGEAGRSQGLLAHIQAAGPDLVLLDWELPGLAAADVLAALRAGDGAASVIALSVHAEAERSALAAGASAFAGKTDPPEQLLSVLRRLMENGDA